MIVPCEVVRELINNRINIAKITAKNRNNHAKSFLWCFLNDSMIGPPPLMLIRSLTDPNEIFC